MPSLLLEIVSVAGTARLAKVLEAAGVRVDVVETARALERARWVVIPEGSAESPAFTIALPARSHQRALYASLADDARRAFHDALAGVIRAEEGTFGRVEAAWHAAQAGASSTSAAMLLEAAHATAAAELQSRR